MNISNTAKTVVRAPKETGYIAGDADGIVTLGEELTPAARHVWLYDASTNPPLGLRHTVSLKNGHYYFAGLEQDKEYLIMARDYKKDYEPFVLDCVKAATDKTFEEQQEMWASWQ